MSLTTRFLCAILALSSVVLVGCGDDDGVPGVDASTPGADASVPGIDASAPDASVPFDAAVDEDDAAAAEDAGTEDAATEDAATEDAATEDAGTEDAGTDDAGTDDAGADDAGAGDAGIDASMPDASMVVTTDVSLSYGVNTGTLDGAWMGYELRGGAVVGLYFELNRRDDDMCPNDSSPVPPQIVTVEGYALATPGTQTYADGVRSSFIDFDGDFMDEFWVDAIDATVVVTTLDTANGIAEGHVDITFEGGTVSGPFRATHCDTLDADAP